MEPILTTFIASAQIPKAFLLVISRAVVPLLVGIVCACIAGALYATFLVSEKIGGFFSSAAGIATGLLIALIVNGLRRDDAQGVDPSIRAGTVALAAIGLFSAMTGQLVTGSTVLRGFLFALAWGGLMAGVLGLVFFLSTHVLSFSASPLRFAVGPRATALVVRKRPAPAPKGTTFHYTLSGPGSVSIAITQRVPGLRLDASCRATTANLSRRRRCTRTVTLGVLKRASMPGANRTRFTGRLGRRALGPGRYQATITAMTVGVPGISPSRSLTFTIIPSRPIG
jgi:hypothetical protein